MADEDHGDQISETTAREQSSRTGGLIGAIVLIALGVIFLLTNLGYPLPGNWWAVLLFIPAGYSLMGAWKGYEHAGHEVTMAVIGPLIGGLVLLALALALLFDLRIDWGIVLPILLIVIGGVSIFRWYSRR